MLSLRHWLLFACLLLVVACSSDSGTTPNDPNDPDDDEPTIEEASIPPTGGSVTIENEAGFELNVSFPSGALLTPTQVSLRTASAPSGVIARFAVEPAGLELLKPVTISLKIPDGVSLDDALGLTLVSGESISVPVEIDESERTVTATLPRLGFNLSAPTAQQTVSIAAIGPPAGLEFIDLEEFDCQLLRDSLELHRARAAAFDGPMGMAINLAVITRIKAGLAACAGDAAAFTALAQQIACDESASAQGAAGTSNSSTIETLKNNLRNLLVAEALVQLSGASCHVPDQALSGEADEFIDAFGAELESTNFTVDEEGWDALWEKLREALALEADAELLGLEDAGIRIREELIPSIFTLLHRTASTACSDLENNGFLADLLSGGHLLGHPIVAEPGLPLFTGLAISDVQTELQLCGSSVFVKSLDSGREVIDSKTVGTGGTREITVTITRGGTFELFNNVAAFSCGAVFDRSVKAFFEIPGRLPKGEPTPFNGLIGIFVEEIARGTLPFEAGDTQFDLVVLREGAPCGLSVLGPSTFELYRIHFVLGPMALFVSPTFYSANIGNQSSSGPTSPQRATAPQSHVAEARDMTVVVENPESQLPDSRASINFVFAVSDAPFGVEDVFVNVRLTGTLDPGLTAVSFENARFGNVDFPPHSGSAINQVTKVKCSAPGFTNGAVLSAASRAGNANMTIEPLGIEPLP